MWLSLFVMTCRNRRSEGSKKGGRGRISEDLKLVGLKGSSISMDGQGLSIEISGTFYLLRL